MRSFRNDKGCFSYSKRTSEHGRRQSPEEVEMVAKGEYYYKNGHHYIFYNETIEGFTEQNRNSIKISENSVEVKKKGLTNMQMIFEEQKKILAIMQLLLEIFKWELQQRILI